jgi:acyl-coenzyme A thioesterase PaaI-like protein
MNIKILKTIDRIITKSESKIGLYSLQKLFILGIPFNKPHGIKFKELTHQKSSLSMVNKRLNHNHLGGIHACAIATVGEFTAGLLLCKNFEMAKYRVIMKDIHVDFYKQARSSVKSVAELTSGQVATMKEEIIEQDKTLICLKTFIYNDKDEEVALVTTNWQLKDWSKTMMK